MELGFDTIGNATLIVHDREPVLVTDPWVRGPAYFGSWGLGHEVPDEQLADISACPFVWFSHGHPDHLNAESLPLFRGKTILVPDHRGGRIRNDLVREGHRVRVLEDRRWVKLSDRVRVLCIADYNQDAILLVDVGGTLVVDLNDASDRGWGTFVRRTVKAYERSFLLSLCNYGDADMMNFHDEDGEFIEPAAAARWPIGALVNEKLRTFGTTGFIPFSSLHRYERADSVWANRYCATMDDYANGFDPSLGELLPAFVRFDVLAGRHEEIAPRERPLVVRDPKDHGDDWSEQLERDEVKLAVKYFRSIERLATFLDFVNLHVGGRNHVIELSTRSFQRGVTFEAPRGSLVNALRYEVFDDILIGNFMKTTLHGRWPARSLYPDFTPYVAKYADNGRAKTHDELDAYFKAYRRRAPFDYIRHHFEERSKKAVRGALRDDSRLYKAAKHVYWRLRSA
ncbi:MAG: MBL fold metallo-hydrolase [Planctomycetota bacterium]